MMPHILYILHLYIIHGSNFCEAFYPFFKCSLHVWHPISMKQVKIKLLKYVSNDSTCQTLQIRNMSNYTNIVTTACDRNIEMAVKILT